MRKIIAEMFGGFRFFLYLCNAFEKSSGDGKLGQLRRLTAADRTAKTAN